MVERKWVSGVFFALNLLVATAIVLPVFYAVCASLMRESDLFQYPPPFLPTTVTAVNYVEALLLAPIFRFIFNSLIVSLACTAGQLVSGALAGYAFSILRFRGQKVLFFIMLATMMIPGQAIIIANYLTISQFGILDSYAALTLPYLTSAFCISNLRQAFLQLPGELREAATIDGCTDFQFFARIALPLTKPNLGALGMYTFLQVWNQYLWPLLVTNSISLRTVQIGIGMLQNADAAKIGPIIAGVVMVLAPSILAFIAGQKQLIEGLTAGSVKG